MNLASVPIDPDGLPFRPLRADAARNRTRVIEAAAAEFAAHGAEAQMEDVARRAGVGVGTVYRHFDTKDALIDAILEVRFRELRTAIEGVHAIEDPWAAMMAAFQATAELALQDRCFAAMFQERKRQFVEEAPVMDDLRELWGGMFARAQSAGLMRRDIGVADLPTLMCGLAAAVSNARSRADWERYLSVLTDGLRRRPGET
jgi:AcrR family transcriptional regulator